MGDDPRPPASRASDVPAAADPAETAAAEPATLGRIRKFLLALLLLAITGTSVELLLLEHFESWRQLLPFAGFGIGALATLAFAVRPARDTLRAFRIVMALFIAMGLYGLYLHYIGNAAFELEMLPEQRPAELFWHALTGATPVMAPGLMVQLGLLGFIATWRAAVR